MPNIVHEFDIRDQTLELITIFNDRAEIKRKVQVSVKAGVNEVKLKNFSRFLVKDTTRVDGRGQSTICDVVEKKIPALTSETDSFKATQIRAEIEENELLLKKLEDEKNIFTKQIDGLSRAVTEIGKEVVSPNKECGVAVVIDAQLLSGLQNLFTFHEAEAESLKMRIREREREIDKVNEIISKLNNSLQSLKNPSGVSRVVCVTLEAYEDGDVELEITYQLFNAGWQPSYDIRVDTEKPSMTITYFGKIFNRTEEDWNDFTAVLSTAQPSLGSRIPELGTLNAHFYRPVMRARQSISRSFRGRGMMLLKKSVSRSVQDDSETIEDELSEGSVIEPSQMEVSENKFSVEFKVAHKATIPTGIDDNKMTIGIITLTPFLLHQSVPSKNASAFLTSSAVNTSAFQFLSGESSIFLNNAFVAKSHMKNVSPGERFTCSLGVDTAVRIQYRPAKKFHEEAGYINKHSANVNEQTISIKNTRSEQLVLLTIKHPVPRSTDEKIRVKLISPAIALKDEKYDTDNEVLEPREGYRINNDNNLEWTVKLLPCSSKDLVIKWVVEHPKGREVNIVEKVNSV